MSIYVTMETLSLANLLEKKREEVLQIYEHKMSKNKKMISDPNTIDFNSKKTINLINAALDKKLKSSKMYQKQIEKELLEKEI